MEFTDKQVEFFNAKKTVLLTILKDDMPIAIPIWGMLYKDAVYMATDSDSRKLPMLEKHAKASATAMQEPPGWPWMRVEGDSSIGTIESFPEFVNFRDAVERIATNYVGEEKAPERFPGDNWKIIKISPTKIVGNV